jgi:hypothetical protein
METVLVTDEEDDRADGDLDLVNETEEEYLERLEIEEEMHPRCQCPYCHCMNHAEAGLICNDCLGGAHQG